MSIPLTDIRVGQIIVYGQIAASGSNVVNTVTTFNYRRLATTVGPSKVDLDTIFQSTVMSKVLLALNARWSQLRNSIRWIDDALDAPFEINHVNPGAVATDAMTSNETVNFRLRTALRGKSYRGAIFLGPLSEADTTLGASDVLNAAAIVKFNDIVTALATDLVAADSNVWRLCVYSRLLSDSLVNPTNIVYNDVTQVAYNKRIGDMRRRKVASVY